MWQQKVVPEVFPDFSKMIGNFSEKFVRIQCLHLRLLAKQNLTDYNGDVTVFKHDHNIVKCIKTARRSC